MHEPNQSQPIHHHLDDKKRADILSLLTLGCSRRKAAQCVGCAPSTITRLIQRDPEFAAKAARAEQNIETLALANIRAACNVPPTQHPTIILCHFTSMTMSTTRLAATPSATQQRRKKSIQVKGVARCALHAHP
jgi:IS30 family transposase